MADARLQRLDLLRQITQAIGDRQEVGSMLGVVLDRLERDLPIDFGCVCLLAADRDELTVTRIGPRSRVLKQALGLDEGMHLPIEREGLSGCFEGQLIHEPAIATESLPFAQRLLHAQLQAVVIAPLRIDDMVFGVLIAARHPAQSFCSGTCEYLKQLSEHVALALHQAELFKAFQKSYDELRESQQVIVRQKQKRALG